MSIIDFISSINLEPFSDILARIPSSSIYFPTPYAVLANIGALMMIFFIIFSGIEFPPKFVTAVTVVFSFPPND